MKAKLMRKLNWALLVNFVLTIMAPLTGGRIHKLASTLFLLLCVVHTLVYRKKLGGKRVLLLGLVLLSFITGLFGMILDQYPIVLMLHRAVSIGVVFFLAVHIFVFYKKLGRYETPL